MKNKQIHETLNNKYSLGFSEDFGSDTIPIGLNEDVVRLISKKKDEPQWLLDWRLQAFKHWQTLTKPEWARVHYPEIDYQAISYYSSPKKIDPNKEIDPDLMAYYEKLGVPLKERDILSGRIAIDAVMDSVSVGTTFKDSLEKVGVIFCSFSEAVKNHPELIKQYLGTVVSYKDNFYAALNSAVFSDGSFCFIPKGVKCPMELSTYFRINQANTGQFERTLIIAEEGSYVSYLEGCFLADTPIWTPNGIKLIQDLNVGDLVYDHKGKPQKVKTLMRRPYEDEVYSIKYVGSHTPIKTTVEHPFLVVTRETIECGKKRKENWVSRIDTQKLIESQGEWVKAKDLKCGDFIFMPHLDAIFSTITKDEAELLGYYLAEGSSYFNKANKQYTNQFSLHMKETDIAERVADIVMEKFGKKSYFTKEPHKNSLTVSFYGKEAHDWFIYHCGKGALNKTLSPALINLPLDIAPIFIEAYRKGDGNTSHRYHQKKSGNTTKVESHRLCTSSFKLVQDLVMLASRMGISLKCVERKAGDDFILGRKISRQKSWQLVWTPNQTYNQIRKSNTGYWIPVTKIGKTLMNTLVYNFEVENTNTYLAHGIAVHNCSAPSRDENQLHAATVELIALDDATIKYATVQNWFPGDENGKGGVYNFVTKRGECRGKNSHISWTQIETGSAITWKYPSVILRGDYSTGEFYSVALTNHYQQADTGTKMIHLGRETKSTIIAKSISAGNSIGTYRGLVRIAKKAHKARNFTQCDSLIFGKAEVYTEPYIESSNSYAILEHEATTSKMSDDHLFYLQQHGLTEEQAKNMLVNGFCKSVFQKLPAEFAVEAQKLLEINLEGSMG